MSSCTHAWHIAARAAKLVSTRLQRAGPAEPVAEHSEQQASHLSGQRFAQHLPTAVDDSYAGVIAAALNA